MPFDPDRPGRATHRGHLLVRVPAVPPSRVGLAPGVHPLGLDEGRDGLVLVPEGLPDGPVPLLTVLHGGGGEVRRVFDAFAPVAREVGAVLLAPAARFRTWDRVHGTFGPDVRFLDRALAHLFAQVPVDPARGALAGVSDGAGYALSLGLGNGGLFRHVMAFSPGFLTPGPAEGRPGVFVSHGRQDALLPVERCGRRIAAALRDGGYDVTYVEYDGGHEVPPEVQDAGRAWLRGRLAGG
jgi:predicted esterase